MKMPLSLITMLMLLFSYCFTYASLEDWSPHVTGSSQNQDVAHGDGIYVLASTNGIYYSSDGSVWSKSVDTDTTSKWFTSVHYGRGFFLACTSSSILASKDGEAWTNVASTSGADWKAIAYGKTKFVVVGNGKIARLVPPEVSGDTWAISIIDEPIADRLTSVVFGNERFVAVNNGSSQLLSWTSLDGENWTRETIGNVVTDNYVGNNSIAYGNGIFVFPKNDNQAYYSQDGVNWTASSPGGYYSGFNAITFDGKQFLWLKSKWLFSSTDAQHWNLVHTFESGNYYCITQSAKRIIVSGSPGHVQVCNANVSDLTISRSVIIEFDVVRGSRYQIESSDDFQEWTEEGASFVAEEDRHSASFKLSTRKFYRVSTVSD